MKKQTFYALSITLTLIGANLCTSCHRLMGEDDDNMIEVDEIYLIETKRNQQDILNNAFDVKDEVTPTTSTNTINEKDSLKDDSFSKPIHDSIRFRKN